MLEFRAYSKENGMREVMGFHKNKRGVYIYLKNGISVNDCIKDAPMMLKTKLLDIDGKEIYQGDIVLTISEFPEKAIVRFDGFEFYLEYLEKLDNDSLKDLTIDLEVIGNVFENGDLL